MIPAISNIAWSPDQRAEAYDLMAGCGVTGLEIAPGLFFHSAADPFVPDAAEARRAMSEAESRGLRLVSMQSLLFGVEGAALFGNAEARETFEHGMTRAIGLAGRFDIPNMVFGSPRQRCIPEGMTPGPAQERAIDTFRRLGDRAERAGTVITVEANPARYGTNFLNTFDEAADFVARVDHPRIRMILDMGAMHLNEQIGLAADRARDHSGRIHHVHVSEPHLAPAPADIAPLSRVLDALSDSGYEGAVSVEMARSDGGLTAVKESLVKLALAISGRAPA
ncbi:sugar phosphate isomerase/epimerase family protein [Citreimonas salinaria]|uniref:Sugar phosphate isomerase/epimerase n=1 Tax=Citreimonas salinaria TaxID=321339 RepID=A0A1H3F0G6_9RHOB|nr:sugar phosphate isomerase/epimerase family protein [Citreimonas salinaria]SDX83788.1 Sugar phosphate isomerase/epimerase [Citreimonas salinaria]